MNWNPIETAPKDGTRIIIFRPYGQRIEFAKWDDDKFSKRPRPYWTSYSIWGTRSEKENCPTHWMPSPEEPK